MRNLERLIEEYKWNQSWTLCWLILPKSGKSTMELRCVNYTFAVPISLCIFDTGFWDHVQLTFALCNYMRHFNVWNVVISYFTASWVLGASKVLIFSQFMQTIAWLKAVFKKQGINYWFISGDIPMKKSAQAIEAFQKVSILITILKPLSNFNLANT